MPLDRQAAASFYLAKASNVTEEDDEIARTCVAAAINAWPDCQLEILDDPLLSLLLFSQNTEEPFQASKILHRFSVRMRWPRGVVSHKTSR